MAAKVNLVLMQRLSVYLQCGQMQMYSESAEIHMNTQVQCLQYLCCCPLCRLWDLTSLKQNDASWLYIATGILPNKKSNWCAKSNHAEFPYGTLMDTTVHLGGSAVLSYILPLSSSQRIVCLDSPPTFSFLFFFPRGKYKHFCVFSTFYSVSYWVIGWKRLNYPKNTLIKLNPGSVLPQPNFDILVRMVVRHLSFLHC